MVSIYTLQLPPFSLYGIRKMMAVMLIWCGSLQFGKWMPPTLCLFFIHKYGRCLDLSACQVIIAVPSTFMNRHF